MSSDGSDWGRAMQIARGERRMERRAIDRGPKVCILANVIVV